MGALRRESRAGEGRGEEGGEGTCLRPCLFSVTTHPCPDVRRRTALVSGAPCSPGPGAGSGAEAAWGTWGLRERCLQGCHQRGEKEVGLTGLGRRERVRGEPPGAAGCWPCCAGHSLGGGRKSPEKTTEESERASHHRPREGLSREAAAAQTLGRSERQWHTCPDPASPGPSLPAGRPAWGCRLGSGEPGAHLAAAGPLPLLRKGPQKQTRVAGRAGTLPASGRALTLGTARPRAEMMRRQRAPLLPPRCSPKGFRPHPPGEPLKCSVCAESH